MAEKRMFTSKIVDSDPFKEMPLSAQALYFHLGMNADDEGFLNNAKSIQRSIMASDDDMKILIAKKFIIPFESGIVAVKHWKMHNQIQPSRLKPTQYTEERALLEVKENKAYTLNTTPVDIVPTDCRQIDDKCCPRLEEISIDKISSSVVIDNNIQEQPEKTPAPTPAHTPPAHITYDSLVKQYGKAFVDERIERAKNYKNCNMSTVAKWCEEDSKANRGKRSKNSFNNFPQRTYDMDVMEKKLLQRNQTVSDDP